MILRSHFSRRHTSVFANDSAVMQLKGSVRANQKHENTLRLDRPHRQLSSCFTFYLFCFIFFLSRLFGLKSEGLAEDGR